MNHSVVTEKVSRRCLSGLQQKFFPPHCRIGRSRNVTVMQFFRLFQGLSVFLSFPLRYPLLVRSAHTFANYHHSIVIILETFLSLAMLWYFVSATRTHVEHPSAIVLFFVIWPIPAGRSTMITTIFLSTLSLVPYPLCPAVRTSMPFRRESYFTTFYIHVLTLAPLDTLVL